MANRVIRKKPFRQMIKFGINYDKHIEDATFLAAYEKKKKELDQLLEDWETVQLEIEELNS